MVAPITLVGATKIAPGTIESVAFINGTVTGTFDVPVLNVSVGSRIKFWNDAYNGNGRHITEVDWSSTGGQLISSDTSKTNYTLTSGKYAFVPQNWADTTILSPGPSDAVYDAWAQGATSTGGWAFYDVEKIAFYVDKTVGSQVWTLVMKFNIGSPASISWNLNVTAPTINS